MKTALIHDPLFAKHDTGAGHPENADRYTAIMDALKQDKKLWERIEKIDAQDATKGAILAAHNKDYYKRVEESFGLGRSALDADTIISMYSFDAARRAAGGLCDAVDAVMTGKARNAFVAARPPGHHATAESSMGFCLFNNAAIAARHAQNRYKDLDRVAIIDWDVHHGNGTQGIFYNDPSVYFFSMHQYPWYPGTGSKGETGFGRGRGCTKNVPVKAATRAQVQTQMFESAINDIRANFTPDLIIISAGFDAHLTDPLGQLLLDDGDFRSMTRTLKDWADEACDGRIVSTLEGGYNIKTLGETVRQHVSELAKGS